MHKIAGSISKIWPARSTEKGTVLNFQIEAMAAGQRWPTRYTIVVWGDLAETLDIAIGDTVEVAVSYFKGEAYTDRDGKDHIAVKFTASAVTVLKQGDGPRRGTEAQGELFDDGEFGGQQEPPTPKKRGILNW